MYVCISECEEYNTEMVVENGHAVYETEGATIE